EAGDQQELKRLFSRRSQADTLRLAVMILAGAIVLLLLVGLFNTPQPVKKASGHKPNAKQTDSAKSAPDLPPDDQYPPLSVDERKRLTHTLMDLVTRAGDPTPRNLNRGLVIGCVATGPTLPQILTVIFMCDGTAPSLQSAEWLVWSLDARLG